MKENKEDSVIEKLNVLSLIIQDYVKLHIKVSLVLDNHVYIYSYIYFQSLLVHQPISKWLIQPNIP